MSFPRAWTGSPRCAPQVNALIRDGELQLSLFDQADLAEITHPDYLGERLVASKNPFLQAERARKRESVLRATEADLAKIAVAARQAARRRAAQTRSRCAPDRVRGRLTPARAPDLFARACACATAPSSASSRRNAVTRPSCGASTRTS
jgi:hypothetical protein